MTEQEKQEMYKRMAWNDAFYKEQEKRELSELNRFYDSATVVTGKRALEIVESAKRFEGIVLSDVYGSISQSKLNSYDRLFDKYLLDVRYNEAKNFHICSHSCQVYTVSWQTPLSIHYITARYHYIVRLGDYMTACYKAGIDVEKFDSITDVF